MCLAPLPSRGTKHERQPATGVESYGLTHSRYQQLIGCSSFDSSNTTNYYARYTTSVICNTLVQNSITPCGLTGTAASPLCADSCVSPHSSHRQLSDTDRWAGTKRMERAEHHGQQRLWHTRAERIEPDPSRLYKLRSASRLLGRDLHRSRSKRAQLLWVRRQHGRSLRLLRDKLAQRHRFMLCVLQYRD